MIRTFLAVLPLLALSACGGDTAPQTVGSNPPPATGGSGGSGGGVGSGGGTPTPTPNPTNFLDVTTATDFDAIGAFHALDRQTTASGTATLYTANASTVQAPSGTVNYNPRDGVFTLTVNDSTASVNRDLRFQDPAHRVQYTPAEFNTYQLPNLANFNYLEVFDGTTNVTLFYQRPGTATTYVSLGGYSRVAETSTTFNAERGVFVFGQKTPTLQVPTAGSGTYTGGILASMVNNTGSGGQSFLQWINGTSNIGINFGTGKVDLTFQGTVGDAFAQGVAIDPSNLAVASGSSFLARGTAQIDLVRSGGFSGVFTQNTATANNVGFTNSSGTFLGVDFASVSAGGATAGASSIDGAFFGPGAVNVGGNFRIVGGVPNQRIDILGAFTGAKQP